jgi:uncharacterized protein (TIGR02300 family)
MGLRMNASLGTKRQCPDCSAKFYDMGALKVACPKCAYAFPIHLTSREEPLADVVAAPLAAKAKHYKVASQEDDAIEGLGAVVELEEFDDDEFDDVDHLEEVEDHLEAPEVDVNGDDADDEMFIDDIADGDVHLIDEPDGDDSYEARAGG